MQGGLDNINLFSIITIMSFFLLAPFCFFKEGATFTPAGLKALGVANPDLVIKQAVLAGVCFHAYQQVCCFLHHGFQGTCLWMPMVKRGELGHISVLFVNGHGFLAEPRMIALQSLGISAQDGACKS